MRLLLLISYFGTTIGLVAALLYWQPQQQPDHASYRQCVQLHPARYCRITHLGGDTTQERGGTIQDPGGTIQEPGGTIQERGE